MLVANRAAYQLQVNDDGSVTLPPDLRSAMGLQTGDSITVIQGEGDVWLLPTRLLVPEVAQQISQLLVEKGMTVDDLLAGLDEERAKLFEERYGNLASS